MNYELELKKLDQKGIGRRVRSAREAAHLTREALSAKLDVTPKFIADIEYGDKGMSIQTLYKIVQVLNQSADYLLAGSEATERETSEEIKKIKENILGPLESCNAEQLKCMEQIARFYAEGLSTKEG